jgi:fumarate reductase flavoprotein subunit
MDIETDVIVIGSGACGLAGALTAAEGGAKVVLFEKQRSLGGSSNFFGGIFAVESAMQRQRYIAYSRDEAFRKIMEYSHWRANARLVRAFVNESAETIAWLQRQGVEFIDATINVPDAPRTYHVVKGAGEAVVKLLAIRAKEKGVDIRPATPVKKILREGGRITGALAETEDGEEIQVKTEAVIVASGGYTNNKEWVKRYTGFDLGTNLMPFGNVGKVGDGIRMAWEVGAAEEGMGVLELVRLGPLGVEIIDKGHIMCAAAQPDLWIDPCGERFCDEGTAFIETFEGNAVARQKEGYTYTLIDESIKERLVKHGIERNLAADNPPGTRLVNFDKELELALEKGNEEVFVANSVAQLAKKIAIDPAVLKATVGEYNGFCDRGHDELFAKDPKYLRPLKGPKFYAIKVYTVSIGTLGGIRVNERMEAVDKAGEPVPGLYAGGFDAGGAYGDSYSFKDSSGMSAAFALNSGRIAGKNILKYIGKIVES